MRHFIFLVLLLFLTSCANEEIVEEKKDSILIEDVNLKTSDNVNIAATYYKSDSNEGIILLHMLNKDKSSWSEFAKKLQTKYKVLAIDLRGHGNSDLNWKSFSDKDFNNMLLDIDAANDFLKMEGANKIAIIGASIGANLALNYGTENDVSTAILLSPGLEYRGIKTEDAITKFNNPILIVTSKKDSYSYDSSNKLYPLAVGKKELKIYEGERHGTDMLDNDLENLISNWLDENF